MTGRRVVCDSPLCQSASKLATTRARLRFVGIDGEGVTTCVECRSPLPETTDETKTPVCRCGNDVWRHDYVLLTIDDEPPLTTNGLDRLQWWEIFEYIHDYQVNNPDACMVGFYLGYDFTQWFRTLPEERAAMLITKIGQAKRRRTGSGGNNTPFPVYAKDPTGREWEFDYLPGRRVKLRPKGRGVWAYVCDTGSYWQSSFLTAIDPKKWPHPLCTNEEYDTIVEGKSARGTAILDKNMMRYNAMENRILSRITDELDTAFRSVDITLQRTQWFGPGQVAQKWLAKQKLVTKDTLWELVPQEWMRAAERTYYGGWFNIPLHGPVSWLEEWDINSAYPYAMTQLPCLEHGTYHEGFGNETPPVTKWIILQIDAQSSDEFIGAGLMCRKPDGSIHTPKRVKGWYWQSEVLAAMKATGMTWKDVRVSRWWAYVSCDCRPPLRGLAGLYDKRLRVGKNSPEGKALKLIYNSCYGKLAQSIGEPKYANPIYASLITSMCRTMILGAIGSHPMGSRAVAMIATDGIYFTHPHPDLVAEEERLGGWDRSEKHNVTLFKPGVYWDDKARKALRDGATSIPLKSRGVNAKALSKHIDAIDALFENIKCDLRDSDRVSGTPSGGSSVRWPSVKVPIPFGIVTPALALARGKWFDCGRIILNDQRDESSDPTSKRDSHVWLDENGNLRTRVYEDGGTTTEYTKFTPDAVPVDLDGVDADRWFTEFLHH